MDDFPKGHCPKCGRLVDRRAQNWNGHRRRCTGKGVKPDGELNLTDGKRTEKSESVRAGFAGPKSR